MSVLQRKNTSCYVLRTHSKVSLLLFLCAIHTHRHKQTDAHTHLPHIYPPQLISMSVRGVQRAQGRRWKKRTEQKRRGAERGKLKENCSPLSSVSFLSTWNMNILNRESALIFYKTGFGLRTDVCACVIVWQTEVGLTLTLSGPWPGLSASEWKM